MVVQGAQTIRHRPSTVALLIIIIRSLPCLAKLSLGLTGLLNIFSTAVSLDLFLGTTHLELDWFVTKPALQC